MPDNVNITPGVGAAIAADDVGGVLHQQVKMTLGGDGVSEGSVSSSNPLPVAAVGELIEALEALRFRLGILVSQMATTQPDVSGKMRAILGVDSNLGTISSVSGVNNVAAVASVTSVTSLTTLGTLTNQANIGGLAAPDVIPAFLRMSAAPLRQNITVT
jgi:hypothetical protein